MATIASTIRTALQAGLNNTEVLEIVKANHPDANTSAACVSYYRSKMKKEGVQVAPKAEPVAAAVVVELDHKELFSEFINSKLEFLGMLWGRWQDEKDHEDINDYGVAFEKSFPADYGWKVIKCTKRPFGFVVQTGTEQRQVTVTARAVNWKRVA